MSPMERRKELLEGMGRDEVRATLRKKQRLSLWEAALFLGISPGTLYNRIARARREPGEAPRGTKKGAGRGGRLEFRVVDLEAWERSREEAIGA